MLSPAKSFEAVLFDLDGTLVATDRFWPDAARAGALRAFAELGVERTMPTSEDWMGLVGLPLAQGFDQLFADLSPDQRSHLLERCVEEEHRLLREGRAGLLPGVLSTLEWLHGEGFRIGVASNCSQAYLDAMLAGTGLGAWVHAARCLHSPGIRHKADMIEELLIEFRTRRALMVGDRDGDRQAAWANGLPHVHLTRGYATSGEEVPAEATLPGMDGLIDLMGRRMQAVEACLMELAPGARGVLGLMGPPAAGKAWFAADLARCLEARGYTTRILDVGDFFQAPGSFDPGKTDLEAQRTLLREDELLEEIRLQGADWTLVHGPGLRHPRYLRALDRVLEVRASWPVVERRIRGGHPLQVPDGLDRVDWARTLWEWDRAAAGLAPARVVAHAQLDGDNWLLP
ncbi:MAG: HAD family hydrolase [Planctomycetes bacterium]|nr:HAD family hydrolase [Planctomycetota bacterium]HPF13881.1 HAD family hydrolase [Planctomycetota bacterium]HRV80712.1 HAD family hydrolase [Planctomycetota bacterium]